MKPLIETVKNPSGFDSLSNYMGSTDFGNFYGFLTQNRDSDILTRSNFISGLEILGGESENVQIHRFGHWACGWWEIIAVKKGTKEFEEAEKIEKELLDYPVVNEDHLSLLEFNEACECWKNASISERVEMCQKYRVSIFKARHNEMPETPTGEWITGTF